jgi:hypothetical protein
VRRLKPLQGFGDEAAMQKGLPTNERKQRMKKKKKERKKERASNE